MAQWDAECDAAHRRGALFAAVLHSSLPWPPPTASPGESPRSPQSPPLSSSAFGLTLQRAVAVVQRHVHDLALSAERQTAQVLVVMSAGVLLDERSLRQTLRAAMQLPPAQRRAVAIAFRPWTVANGPASAAYVHATELSAPVHSATTAYGGWIFFPPLAPRLLQRAQRYPDEAKEAAETGGPRAQLFDLSLAVFSLRHRRESQRHAASRTVVRRGDGEGHGRLPFSSIPQLLSAGSTVPAYRLSEISADHLALGEAYAQNQRWRFAAACLLQAHHASISNFSEALHRFPGIPANALAAVMVSAARSSNEGDTGALYALARHLHLEAIRLAPRGTNFHMNLWPARWDVPLCLMCMCDSCVNSPACPAHCTPHIVPTGT